MKAIVYERYAAPDVLELRDIEVPAVSDDGVLVLRDEDVGGLELLKELAGERFRRGIVLYSGRQCVPLGKDLHALPIESLWRMRAQNKRT